MGRSDELAAKTPWNVVRCLPIGGTSATNRFTNSSAVSTNVVPRFVASAYRPSTRPSPRSSSAMASRRTRVGETIDIVWDELSEPAASYLDLWTQLTKGHSTIGFSERPSKLWLHRQDVERSLELEAVVP